MKQGKLVKDSLTVKQVKDMLKGNIERFEIDLKDETMDKVLTEILIKHYRLILGLMEKL